MNTDNASASIIQLNEWGCKDVMHHAKNSVANKEIALAILSRILAQSCVILYLTICREGLRMIMLESLIVLLKGFTC